MINSQTTVSKYETHIVILDARMTAFWTDPLTISQSNHRVCVCGLYSCILKVI